MATFRQRALNEAAMHQTGRFYEEEGPVSGYFGKNVLDLDKMRSYMSEKAYNAVLASVKFGAKLDRSVIVKSLHKDRILPLVGCTGIREAGDSGVKLIL